MAVAVASEAQTLAAGAAELGLDLPPTGVERLLSFLAELRRWNRAYNLVSASRPTQWVERHLLDSLSIAVRLRTALAASIPGRASGPGPYRVLDLGAGAGLPGIPLAIALPEVHVVLLDANGKKVRFCRHAAAALGLSNVETVAARAEHHAPPVPFDAVVTRAVGRLAQARDLVRGSCRGWLFAMKGRYPAEELTEMADVPVEVVRLRVPGLAAERHLVVFPLVGRGCRPAPAAKPSRAGTGSPG